MSNTSQMQERKMSGTYICEKTSCAISQRSYLNDQADKCYKQLLPNYVKLNILHFPTII